MKTTLPKAEEVREELVCDQVTKRHNRYTARRGFYYRNGYTAEAFVKLVRAAYPAAKIIDSGEIWKPFRGGAKTQDSSHWFVTFEL